MQTVEYWRDSLAHAVLGGHLHWSMFQCSDAEWHAIQERHRDIILRLNIGCGSYAKILDAGCGYGDILQLMVVGDFSCYLGIDLSPHLLTIARQNWPGFTFLEYDLRQPLKLGHHLDFDWAICRSFRSMILREDGPEAWEAVRTNLFIICDKILYLEYDVADEGEVECRPET